MNLLFVAAAALTLHTSGLAAAQAHAITVDATQLLYEDFLLQGPVVTGWTKSRANPVTLQLVEGTYNFQVGSGFTTDFQIKVTPQGTVDVVPSPPHTRAECDRFLRVNGATLTFTGLPVTFDARFLTGQGVLPVLPDASWIELRSGNMLPASNYSVQQGSGQVAGFTFRLGYDGHFAYDRSFDIANGGFLAGIGTNRLQFLGYPVIIDARLAGGTGVTLQSVWGLPFSTTGVLFADLLPGERFALQIKSGVVSNVTFKLDTAGRFSFDSASARFLRLEAFHGIPVVKVTAPLP